MDLYLMADGGMANLTNAGPDPTPVFLKRVADHPNAGPRSFDVASVKRAAPPPCNGFSSSMKLDAGRLTCTNVSLKKLIYESYGARDYQVSGPDWLSTEIYDMAATLPPGTTGDDVLPMIQTLLAERFKLTLHRESKDLPVYALVVGKNGSKLEEVEFGRGGNSGSPGKLTAARVPIRNLLEFLSRQTGRPVLDITGLKGFYSFTLIYAPDEAAATAGPGTAPKLTRLELLWQSTLCAAAAVLLTLAFRKNRAWIVGSSNELSGRAGTEVCVTKW